MHGNDGDGHGRLVIFEKNQPDFPGLIFEAPSDPPKADSSDGVQHYRARQIQARIPGKLYYVVVLDAAASIEEPAMKDYANHSCAMASNSPRCSLIHASMAG